MNSVTNAKKQILKLQRISRLNELKQKRALDSYRLAKEKMRTIEREVADYEKKHTSLITTEARLAERFRNRSAFESDLVLDIRNFQNSQRILKYELEKNRYFSEEAEELLLAAREETAKAMQLLQNVKTRAKDTEGLMRQTEKKMDNFVENSMMEEILESFSRGKQHV